MKLSGLAARNIIKKPARTTVLMIIVAFLSFAVFAGTIISLSLSNGVESLERRMGADVIVVPDTAKSKVDLNSILLQGTPGYFYMDKSYLDKVAQVEGVETASPQYFLASVSAGCCSVPAQIIGIDEKTDFVIKPWISQVYSSELADGDVIVGSNINGEVGGTVRFYDVDCRVAARLEKTGTGLDTAVYTNENTVKNLIKASVEKGENILAKSSPDQLISTVYIKAKDGVDPKSIADYINVHIRHITAIRTKSMFTDIAESMHGITDTARIILIVLWILAFVIMLTAFGILINERKKEFAVLRVAGLSRKMLAGVILKEAFLISLFGGLIGIGAASAVIWLFSSHIEAALGMPFLLPNIAVIILIAAIALGLTLIVGPLSSVYCAGRLSRLDAGKILREG